MTRIKDAKTSHALIVNVNQINVVMELIGEPDRFEPSATLVGSNEVYLGLDGWFEIVGKVARGASMAVETGPESERCAKAKELMDIMFNDFFFKKLHKQKI